MPANAGIDGSKVIRNPRRLYVSYLTTSAIVECMVDINWRLADPSQTISSMTRDSYKMILRDLDEELTRRQMSFDELA